MKTSDLAPVWAVCRHLGAATGVDVAHAGDEGRGWRLRTCGGLGARVMARWVIGAEDDFSLAKSTTTRRSP